MMQWFSISLILLFSITTWAQSRMIGFNWGQINGVEAAILSAQTDSPRTETGFRLGPKFWKSLERAQFESDHHAGDGFYFSTNPYNSTNFGPALIITEIVSPTGQLSDIIPSMNSEQIVRHRSSELPAVISYKGSWHVIKRLPIENEPKQLEIFIRKPTLKDAEAFFLAQNYQIQIVDTVGALTKILQRGIKKDNKSTRRFIDRLKELLITEGLVNRKFLTQTELDNPSAMSHQISDLLNRMNQFKNEKEIFGIDLKKLIYKTFLEKIEVVPNEVKVTLFLVDAKLAVKLTEGRILSVIVEELLLQKNADRFLRLKSALLEQEISSRLTPQEILIINEKALPLSKISMVDIFNPALFETTSEKSIEDYFKWWNDNNVSTDDAKNLQKLRDRITQFKKTTSQKKSCRALF